MQTPQNPGTIRLLNALPRFRGKGARGWMANCPAHEDRVESLSIDEEHGRTLIKCFAGCPTENVLDALRLTVSDLFVEEHTNGYHIPAPLVARTAAPVGMEQEELVAIYQYTDGHGRTLAEKGRFELTAAAPALDGKRRKSFKWRLPGSEKWTGLQGIAITDLALWGAEEVAATPGATVYVCEGEKATLACRAQGLLAVTLGGGSSAREYGAALDLLRGRRVALWPDNDAVGKEYMAAIHARLRGMAASVDVIAVALPPKGDAADFFALGGTVVDLTGSALPVGETSVEYLGDDHLLILAPQPLGVVRFEFSEMEKSPRSLDTELTISVQGVGVTSSPYAERINLLSSSARTELRRDLETVYGKGWGWSLLLNTIFNLARERFVGLDRSEDLYDIEDSNDQDFFLVDTLVPADAPTIIFGEGGALKSYFVFDLALCMAFDLEFLGYRTKSMPVLIVDYEDTAKNFRRRMSRLASGLGLPGFLPGLIQRWPAHGIPLCDQADAIRRKVVTDGIGLVIVDSAAPAVGGDVERSPDVLAFFRALAKIGTTSLILAHVTKNGMSKTDYPFGSIFFHNEARRTWYVAKVQEEESDDMDVALYCRKGNDGQRVHPITVHAHFDGFSGAVSLSLGRMADVPELQGQRPLKWRIWDALDRRTMTSTEIADAIRLESDSQEEADALAKTVDSTIRRNLQMFSLAEKRGVGGRAANVWGRAARE